MTGIVTRGRLVWLAIHVSAMAGDVAAAHADFSIDLPARHGEVIGLHVGGEVNQVRLDIRRRCRGGEPLAVNAPAILGVSGRAVTVNIVMTTQAGVGRTLVGKVIIMQIITPVLLIEIRACAVIKTPWQQYSWVVAKKAQLGTTIVPATLTGKILVEICPQDSRPGRTMRALGQSGGIGNRAIATGGGVGVMAIGALDGGSGIEPSR